VSEVVLALNGVGKILGDRWVLANVNLELREGECLVVSGANGAGKTTLLQIVVGLYRRSKGTMVRFGRPLPPQAAGDRHIGFLAADNFCHPALTLEENLRLTASLWRVARPEEAVERAIGVTELGWCRRDVVGIYSRGMRQRAGLARLVVQRPRLWVLDEPWQGLDWRGRQIFHTVMQSALEGGAAILAAVPLDDGSDPLFAQSVRLEHGRVQGGISSHRPGGKENYGQR
jgi:ABC-type multidrug transport system ATPase subunit